MILFDFCIAYEVHNAAASAAITFKKYHVTISFTANNFINVCESITGKIWTFFGDKTLHCRTARWFKKV